MLYRTRRKMFGVPLQGACAPVLAMMVLLCVGATPAPADEPRGAELAAIGPKPAPLESIPSKAEIQAAIDRGVEFVLERQNPTGSWGTSHWQGGVLLYAPVPGSHQAFQCATTSLVISGLIELDDDDPRVVAALDRGETWLMNNLPRLRRATPDAIYNSWGHAYGIQALVRMLRRHEGDDERCEKIRAVIEQQVDLLGRYECVDGGWCYYDFDYGLQRPGGSSIGFVTATVLVAFREAADVGIEIPERLVERGKASILRQRKADFTYLYGEYLKTMPVRAINRASGSLGRSQACSIAMRYWGDEAVTDEILVAWLDRLFARNGWLSMGRKKPVPHESFCQVAGYFYYYGHYYAERCIEELSPEQQKHYNAYMATTIMALQENDGSWFDYPLYGYHKEYGTGFSLQILAKCRETAE